MKYYAKPDGTITKVNNKGYEEYTSPIHPDGKTILPKHEALEYDVDGNITNPDVVAILEDTAKVQALADWKSQRQAAVDNIEVEYNSVIFQGDEKSQDRMSRAINGLPDDTTTIDWVAKDNSIHQLTRVDFRTILGRAGAIQASLWNNRPTI